MIGYFTLKVKSTIVSLNNSSIVTEDRIGDTYRTCTEIGSFYIENVLIAVKGTMSELNIRSHIIPELKFYSTSVFIKKTVLKNDSRC